MAFITDPDNLNDGTELVISTAAKTVQLVAAGNLADVGNTAADNGATGQALYSKLKELWKSNATYIKFPFPMVAITPEQFEFVEDWVPADDTTRQFIRTAGWKEITAGDVTEREYLGVIGLGAILSGNTCYYFFDSDAAATDFDFEGSINQAVQTFGDATNGNFNKLTDIFAVNIRVFGNTYDQSTTPDIGIASGATLPTNCQRFPLSESTDLKITNTLADVFTTPVAPYNDMSISYYATPQTRSGFVPIGGDTPSPGDAQFGVIIDGDISAGGAASAEQVYEFVQASLQATTDIDAIGTRIGQLQDPLLEFVGDNLNAVLQSVANAPAGGDGVAIDNYSTNDTNRLQFVDNDDDNRTYPFVAAGQINFNNNLSNEPVAAAAYWMFFTNANGNAYGTASAIIVDDNSVVDIQGDIDGATFAAFDFDYDGNVQGGRTAATDADITIVAIGTAVAQFVVATGTITRNVGQSFSLVAALERNYSNPV